MMKKFSITLLVAMFSLLIGFGATAPAFAAGECAEPLLANGASENAAFTNCRAFEADAARYTAMAAYYANETNGVQRAFEADAARYAGLAALYTNETRARMRQAFEADAARSNGLAAYYTAKSAGTCLGITSTDMTAVKFVSCLSDSTYQAANPELMAGHRFAVAGGSVASQPVFVDIEVLRNNNYYSIQAARYGDSATQTDPTAEPAVVTVEQPANTRPDYYYSGR